MSTFCIHWFPQKNRKVCLDPSEYSHTRFGAVSSGVSYNSVHIHWWFIPTATSGREEAWYSSKQHYNLPPGRRGWVKMSAHTTYNFMPLTMHARLILMQKLSNDILHRNKNDDRRKQNHWLLSQIWVRAMKVPLVLWVLRVVLMWQERVSLRVIKIDFDTHTCTCRWLGKIAHLSFMFFVVVILHSLLVAQMDHTYSVIQEEANTLLVLVRARNVLSTQKSIAGLPKIVCLCMSIPALIIIIHSITTLMCYSLWQNGLLMKKSGGIHRVWCVCVWVYVWMCVCVYNIIAFVYYSTCIFQKSYKGQLLEGTLMIGKHWPD